MENKLQLPQSQSQILGVILSQLKKVRKSGASYKACCPAHDDKTASFSVTPLDDGGIRLKCFAGCDFRSICAALGVDSRDLTTNKSYKSGNSKEWIFYDYVDENGNLICQHVRIPKGKDKTFLWCRPDGRGSNIYFLGRGWYKREDKKWERAEKASDPEVCPESGAVWFDDCRRVPYRLDRITHLEPGATVFIVEGEKDVHTTEGFGFVATTGGGAEDWRHQFGEYFTNLDVIICADNDRAGREFESKVIASIREKAKRIRILRLPDLKEKGDITDWAKAGGTRGKLEKLIEQAPDYEEIVFSNRIALIPTDGDDATDPVISDDPEREALLRQMAANAGDVIDAVWLLFRMLGIKGKHSRIVNALMALATDSKKGVNLGLVRAFHSKIHAEYDSDREDLSSEDSKQKSNRVSRDLQKLIAACVEAGAAHKTTSGCFGFLDYWHGSPEHQGRVAIPGRYRMNFLRFALLILDRAREIGGKPREAREQAAKEVACEVLAWVGGRVRDLGEQPTSDKEKEAPEPNPLKDMERKREAAIRAFTSYARLLGSDRQKVDSAFSAIRQEVMKSTTSSELLIMSSENETVAGRSIAAEIEAEYTLRAMAEKLRQAWQEQGLSRNQAVLRVRSLLRVFILALFAGSEFKRKKIKSLAHSLVNEAVEVVEAPMSRKIVGQGKREKSAIIADLEKPPMAKPSKQGETHRSVWPPGLSLHKREKLTDPHYRGPVIYKSADGEIGGKLIAFFDEREGEQWLSFEALDGSGRDGPVPLSALYEPDDDYDAELIERWKQSRLGGMRPTQT
jgi:DNA primase